MKKKKSIFIDFFLEHIDFRHSEPVGSREVRQRELIEGCLLENWKDFCGKPGFCCRMSEAGDGVEAEVKVEVIETSDAAPAGWNYCSGQIKW